MELYFALLVQSNVQPAKVAQLTVVLAITLIIDPYQLHTLVIAKMGFLIMPDWQHVRLVLLPA